jgi:hypothetical protein
VRISKVPRVLLAGVIAGLGTGVLAGIALVGWPELWPGWLVLAWLPAFWVLWCVADIATHQLASRSGGE